MASFSHANSSKLVSGTLIRIVSPCQEGSGKSVMTNYSGREEQCLGGQSSYVGEVHCARARLEVHRGGGNNLCLDKP